MIYKSWDFPGKINRTAHLSLKFDNSHTQSATQKHKRMTLNNNMDFQNQFTVKLSKISNAIASLRKPRKILSRPTLLTIFLL